MPPRKREKKVHNEPAEEPAQQAVRRNVRGRRGGLKDMPGMPLDILIEIFGFMHPRDLLNLARTSKPFRGLLMSHSSQAMWKASIEGVEGLPKCPPYMNEPTYINLLFFPHCHGCLKPNVQTVLFEFGARYCNVCKPKMLLKNVYSYDILQSIRTLTGAEYGQPFARNKEGYYHKPEIDAFLAQWYSMPDDDSKKVLAATSLSRVKMMHEMLPSFSKWRDNQKSKRSIELHQIKVERFESIKTKLRQAGWAEELGLMNNWQQTMMQDKFASKAEPLTERAWQKIRESAVAYMEDIKRRRLDAARRVVLRGRFERFVKAYETYRGDGYRRTAESDLEPHLMDLAVTNHFRDILDLPDDADMNILDDAEEMFPKFEDAILGWQTSRRLELTDMAFKSTPPGADLVDLTPVLFACRLCKRADLRYPAVIAHVCNRVVTHEKELYASSAARFWSPRCSRSPWSSRYLSVSTSAMSALRPIVEACGLDPERATFKQMDDCPARLTCTGCSMTISGKIAGPRLRQYTTYRTYDCWTALRCALEMKECVPRGKPARKHHDWARVSKAEEVVIKKLDADPTAHRKAFDTSKWLHGCCYCDYSARPRKMSRHLKNCHDITVEIEDIGTHAYRHHDGKPKANPLFLKRYDDGSATAEYGSAFSPFGLAIDSDYDYDYDSDIDPVGWAFEWDSDMDYDFDF
ncbi:hypothetical protein L226DRAFT_608974 [Lentinus tigrinus ALCF2SS1-7]|uniref:uncharacterized protein n=1 Tax=Lentinus tigrinus ALCF2SS1-7 TaxID=1328758 RepID=UPI0011662D09|nr:hypothetical protein L226DRAFT_608974 [Lentinus tigrinus ALCF2SS1-7]